MRFTIIHIPHWLILLLVLLLAALTALLLSVCFSPQEESALAPQLLGRCIVLDSGHGGWDMGAEGELGPEADINLAVAMKLAEYCRMAGATVILTRDSNQALADEKQADLQARIDMAEEYQADIFISIHCNSYVSEPNQHGAQIFYQKGQEKSQLLAETLQTALKTELENTDRAALIHPNSYLLKNLDIPAVIAEIGFISNQQEEGLLHQDSYQWDMAWAMFLGINEYCLAE